jgi:hypothetical protein
MKIIALELIDKIIEENKICAPCYRHKSRIFSMDGVPRMLIDAYNAKGTVIDDFLITVFLNCMLDNWEEQEARELIENVILMHG